MSRYTWEIGGYILPWCISRHIQTNLDIHSYVLVIIVLYCHTSKHALNPPFFFYRLSGLRSYYDLPGVTGCPNKTDKLRVLVSKLHEKYENVWLYRGLDPFSVSNCWMTSVSLDTIWVQVSQAQKNFGTPILSSLAVRRATGWKATRDLVGWNKGWVQCWSGLSRNQDWILRNTLPYVCMSGRARQTFA